MVARLTVVLALAVRNRHAVSVRLIDLAAAALVGVHYTPPDLPGVTAMGLRLTAADLARLVAALRRALARGTDAETRVSRGASLLETEQTENRTSNAGGSPLQDQTAVAAGCERTSEKIEALWFHFVVTPTRLPNRLDNSRWFPAGKTHLRRLAGTAFGVACRKATKRVDVPNGSSTPPFCTHAF